MKRTATNTKSKTYQRAPAHKTSAGTMLRAAREKMGLTLRDVEAVTGLLSGGISFLENGRSVPDLLTAYTLCQFYNISLEKLADAVLKDES